MGRSLERRERSVLTEQRASSAVRLCSAIFMEGCCNFIWFCLYRTVVGLTTPAEALLSRFLKHAVPTHHATRLSVCLGIPALCDAGARGLSRYLMPRMGLTRVAMTKTRWACPPQPTVVLCACIRTATTTDGNGGSIKVRRADDPSGAAPSPAPREHRDESTRWGILDHRNVAMTRRRTLRMGPWIVEYTFTELALHAGFVITALSYLESDLVTLRTLAVLGSVSAIMWQYYKQQPTWLAIRWNILFMLINIAWVSVLLLRLQRAESNIDDEEDEVFEDVFATVGMKRMDYYQLLKKAIWRDIAPGKVLVREGDEHQFLFLLVEGDVVGERLGTPVYRFKPGDFVGDLAFIRGSGEASYTVRAGNDARVLVWELDELREMLEDRPELAMSLRSLLGRQVVRKLEMLQSAATADQGYHHLLQGVLVDGEVTSVERRALREYRQNRGVSRETHNAALEALGWTVAEYAAGKKEKGKADSDDSDESDIQ